MEKLQLFGTKIQVEAIQTTEVGGIQLVSNAENKPASARVTNVGDEVQKVRVGDEILVDPYMIMAYTLPNTTEINLIDEKYVIGKLVPDILGV